MTLLPTEKSIPSTSLEDYTVLIHGAPKIGKSTWCSQIPNALFLDMEAGLTALEVYKTPLIENWETFLEGCVEISGTNKFNAVVIDTVERAYQLCLTYVCTKRGIEHPGTVKKDFGAAWSAVTNEFYRVLTKLASLPIGLFLISHSKGVEVETRTETYTRMIPNLSEGVRKCLTQTVSTILYFTQRKTKDGIERIICCHPSLYYEAGTRIQQLKNIPEVMPMDYTAFASLFSS